MEMHLLREERSRGWEHLWEMGHGSTVKTQAKQIGNCTVPKGGVRSTEKVAPPQPAWGHFVYLSWSQIQSCGVGRAKSRLLEE